MSIFTQPDFWQGEVLSDTPPWMWEALALDTRWWFYNDTGSPNGGTGTGIFPLTPQALTEDTVIAWEVTEARDPDEDFTFRYWTNVGITVFTDVVIPGDVIGTGTFTIPSGTTVYKWTIITNFLPKIYTGVLAIGDGPSPDVTDEMNCDCETASEYETLAELRARMMVRLGYAAQKDNPPTGMLDLIDDWLRSEQKRLYAKHPALRTERFYHWTMTPGTRYYGIQDNEETCPRKLDPYKVSWVGYEDLNGQWLPLRKGIPPELYTAVNLSPSFPSRYEIRSCIEIWPAPQSPFKLWIKGHFGLESLVEVDDRTSIDSELVFLHALALGKAHYGKPDANATGILANGYLLDLIAGKHQTARYIPGNRPATPWIQPRFIPNQEP